MDNDGIRGGEGAETGDLEAQPTENEGLEATGDPDDLAVLEAGDPRLGLTGVNDVPADDWAADTGPDRTAEEGTHGVSTELSEESISEEGEKIDFEPARRN